MLPVLAGILVQALIHLWHGHAGIVVGAVVAVAVVTALAWGWRQQVLAVGCLLAAMSDVLSHYCPSLSQMSHNTVSHAGGVMCM